MASLCICIFSLKMSDWLVGDNFLQARTLAWVSCAYFESEVARESQIGSKQGTWRATDSWMNPQPRFTVILVQMKIPSGLLCECTTA